MIKMLFIVGTRPEAIKMVPAIKAAQALPGEIESIVCSTGQHKEMLYQIFNSFGLTPDIELSVMTKNQSLAGLSSIALERLDKVYLEHQPDIVLVQGDTTTAMIGALTAHYHKIPVGHIEAGLRTGKRYNPFPEEMNRRLISALGALHFAPTQRSVDALLKEGQPSDRVYLTGNTVVDALYQMRDILKIQPNESNEKLILVTAHRRENFDKPLRDICKALKDIVNKHPDVRIVYPVHLNPNIKDSVYELLDNHSGIRLIEPLPYDQLIPLMASAYIILTDSGGIQEEAPAFGIPVLVMRKTTERPEGIDAGVAKLVGTDSDVIFNEASRLISDEQAYQAMAKATNPYGDGNAGKRIIDHCLTFFGNK